MGKQIASAVGEDRSTSLQVVDPTKRKFNIAKVAGSATNLEYIKNKDRVFEERKVLP